MNAASYHHDDLFSFDPNLKGPFVGSVLFHLLILTIASFGLPYIAKDTELLSTPISVEIVEISDITQTNRVAPPKKAEEEPEKPSPPIEKLNPPQTEEPPPLPTPKAPEAETIPPPEPPKAEAKPKPIEKPKPPEPKKIPPKKEVTKKIEQENDFQSLLKNLTPDVEVSAEDPAAKELNKSAQPSQIAQMGDRMTVSEQDAIAAQIYPCWNVPSGAKFAEDLTVEIRVFMSRDGMVTSTQILDQLRYSQDSYYKAAADAAERALRNPRCMPLKYPPEKYEQMKAFVFRFDPSQML